MSELTGKVEYETSADYTQMSSAQSYVCFIIHSVLKTQQLVVTLHGNEVKNDFYALKQDGKSFHSAKSSGTVYTIN